jgi:hypothetical protein
VNIRFDCPACEQPASLDVPAPADWQCPRCDHLVRLADPGNIDKLSSCAICGNPELYKKKDFPHWLGMTILTVACIAFLVINAYRYPWLAWTILIVSAAFDGWLYLWVGDVTVCYRCNAHFRGFPSSAAQKPYDLGIAERYRQERIRREQLEAERKK